MLILLVFDEQLINKNTILPKMKKERKENQFIRAPQYPGGLNAMRKFIATNLKYPKEALENKIEGSVYVRYGINNKGKVIETKVISSLGYGCDEEAQRLIRLMSFEVEKVRKVRVIYHRKLRVYFKMPVPEKKSISSVQYKLKPSKKKTEKGTNQKSYSYTVRF